MIRRQTLYNDDGERFVLETDTNGAQTLRQPNDEYVALTNPEEFDDVPTTIRTT